MYDMDAYPSENDYREYGLGLVQIDSGEVIAVCVSDDVKALGIEVGNVVMADGAFMVSFPCGLVLDENGVPNVDTKADRISRNPVEERIPFDMDAAMAICRD